MKLKGKELTKETWKELIKPGKLNMEELVTTIGLLKAERKLIQTIEEFCIEAFKGRQVEELDEDFGVYHVRYTREAGRVTPDKEKIVSEMGEEWWNAHLKKGEDYWMLKITDAK